MTRKILTLLLAVICVSSCDWFSPDEKEVRSMLIYVAANNNLSRYADSCFTQLKRGYIPVEKNRQHILMVYSHTPGKAPSLSRYYVDKRGIKVEEIIRTYPENANSATASQLRTVIADAENAYPADIHDLVLWSHATGFLPQGYFSNPKERTAGGILTAARPNPYAALVKSDGELKSFARDSDGKLEIEIQDLVPAISRNHYEMIIFDCCLMGGIEVAYQMRGSCDYMVASPTEILAQGFPYDKILDKVFNEKDRELAVNGIAKSYMDYYWAQSGSYQCATVSVVKTAALERVAECCRRIFEGRQNLLMTINRSSVQAYFYSDDRHWYYDLDDLIGKIADQTQYAEFQRELSRAVIFKETTPHFFNLAINHYSGLSVYIPREEYSYLNNYYRTLDWNKATRMIQ